MLSLSVADIPVVLVMIRLPCFGSYLCAVNIIFLDHYDSDGMYNFSPVNQDSWIIVLLSVEKVYRLYRNAAPITEESAWN